MRTPTDKAMPHIPDPQNQFSLAGTTLMNRMCQSRPSGSVGAPSGLQVGRPYLGGR